jgi:general L-amino acid transport system permease protein
VLAIIILAGVGGFLVHNTAVNLAKRESRRASALSNQAGFEHRHRPHPVYDGGSYPAASVVVSVVNTLVVSAVGIVIATILGFVIGIARLSRNWLVATLAAVYVDAIRNIPLLAQIIFWYFGLLPLLPQVRQSVPVFNAFFFSNRGLYMPKPELLPGFWMVPAALVVGIALAIVLHRWAKRRQAATGQLFPSVLSGLGLTIGVPLLVMLVSGSHVDLSMPELKGFNFQGGMVVVPEFLALLLALSIYTAAFIAEIRPASLRSAMGQTEAALASASSRASRCARRHSAGATRDRAAADQPIPQPGEKLDSRHLHRLSRRRAGVCRDGGQPDRPGRGGHRHHAGVLSGDQPAHLGGDELVQPARGAGGALKR